MSKKPETNSRNNKKNSASIDKMWKAIGVGKIDISYACVGYSLNGRPILDYALFIELLVSCGFSPDDADLFIAEFSEMSSKDSTTPIVMTDSRRAKILTEVQPLQ